MMAKLGIFVGAVLSLTMMNSGYAVDSVMVLGLFKNKVVLKVDGKRRVLKTGQTSPEGVKLVAANSRGAELEIDGQIDTYKLGSKISTSYEKPKQIEVHLWRNKAGMYRSVGSINGLPVNLLVDTGASTVALNANEAKRLGIDFRVWGTPTWASTASGTAKAYAIKLKLVKVGDIELSNVDGMVVDGDHPRDVLLGMSFLGKLQLERKGGEMILRKTY